MLYGICAGGLLADYRALLFTLMPYYISEHSEMHGAFHTNKNRSLPKKHAVQAPNPAMNFASVVVKAHLISGAFYMGTKNCQFRDHCQTGN